MFALMCGLLLRQAYEEARLTAEQATMNLAQAMSRDVTRTIGVYDSALQEAAEAAGRPEIENLPPALRQTVLFHRPTDEGYLGETILLDAEGHVTDRSGESWGARDAAAMDFFRYHKGNPADRQMHVGQPFIGRADNAPDIALSRAIYGADGALVGVVACIVPLDYFRGLFEEIDVGPHGLIALMNDNGTLLMRKPLNIKQIGSDVSAITRHFAPSGTGTFMARSPLDGLDRAYVYKRAANAPLVTLIGTSGVDMFQAWRRKAWAFAIGLAAITGTGCFVVWLLRREMHSRSEAEQQRRQSEDRFRLLAERSSDAITLRDASGVRVYASPSFYRVIGWTPEALANRSMAALIHPEDLHDLTETYQRLARGEDTVARTYRIRRQDGSYLWAEARVSAIFDARGAIVNVISNLRDISKQKADEEELAATAAHFEMMAVTDKLTGLANRRRLDERLEQEWRRAQRNHSSVALLLLDADNFKAYNDRYGHPRGDAVLQAIATCIIESLRRPIDLGARYGGEEFAVLLPETSEAQALLLAERIRDQVAALHLPHADAARGHVTVSIGVAALRPHEMIGFEALIEDADAALYCAKRLGKDRCVGMTEARLAPAGDEHEAMEAET